jgi:hypothetical protein
MIHPESKKAISMISLFNSQIKQQAKIMVGNATCSPSVCIDTTSPLIKNDVKLNNDRQLTSSSILSHIVATNLNKNQQNSPQHDEQ